jgi:hypothetical protein
MKQPREFDGGGNCPICRKTFKSDDCPHSWGDAERRITDQRFQSAVAKEVRRQLARQGGHAQCQQQ